MTTPLNLVAVVGSLRADALSRVVFNAAVEVVGSDATITEVSLREVPFYDGDVEAVGDPDAVTTLKQAVMSADGLLIFTPEYNRSMPAVTKNAIDWLSRVPGDSALTNAAVGVVASTPGRHAVEGVRQHASDSLSITSGHFFPETHAVSGVKRKMVDGRLADDETLEALRDWLAAFVDHIKNRPEIESENDADS